MFFNLLAKCRFVLQWGNKCKLMTFCQSVSVYFFSTVYHIINWKSRAINYKLKQLTLLLSRDEIICKVDISLSSYLSYSSNTNGLTFYTE